MASNDVYVVTATQLNRRVKVDDEWEPANLSRGTEFQVGDAFSDGDPGVTEKEIKRWLSLQPRVIASKADLEKAQQTADDAREQLAEAQAQIDELTRQLSAARAAGAVVPEPGGSPGTVAGGGGAKLEEPTGNASADAWRAYAKQQDPGRDPAEIDATSRDDLRAKYGTATS